MIWLILKKVSVFLLAFLLLAVLADVLVFVTVEYGRKGAGFVGCYAYDAMLVGFECQGFYGSSIISAWLNWPLTMVFAPIFAIFSLRALGIAILVWLPFISYIFSAHRLRSKHGV